MKYSKGNVCYPISLLLNWYSRWTKILGQWLYFKLFLRNIHLAYLSLSLFFFLSYRLSVLKYTKQFQIKSSQIFRNTIQRKCRNLYWIYKWSSLVREQLSKTTAADNNLFPREFILHTVIRKLRCTFPFLHLTYFRFCNLKKEKYILDSDSFFRKLPVNNVMQLCHLSFKS